MGALVTFTRDNSHWAAGLLSRECRHVFCSIFDPRTNMWLTHDLGRGGLTVRVDADGSFDLKAFYEDQGHEVYAVPYNPQDISYAPMLLNNCVGFTKALLGIRSNALTPHQLRRHVRRIDIGEIPCVDFALT